MGQSTLAISSGSVYNYGLARFFELARAAEAEAVEVIVDERWDTRQPGYLLRLAEQFALPIVALHAPFMQVKEMADDYLGCVRATVRLAESVGARVVVVHPEWAENRTLAARVRRAAAELQADTRVLLAVENMPFQRLVRRPRYPTHTIERIGRFPAITLDTAHFGTAGIDLLAAQRGLADRTRHVHLSDSLREREHLMPGDGNLPLASFLRLLAQDNYAGIVTIELMPSAIGADDEASVLANLRRALAFCREHLAEREPVKVGG